ncbi:MAG TPA: PilZ domain-containing protein [Candidatus Sumerlaeota bacterium]|nr:PilZ domain-containing protein [Candidatus Sumerlaeota bacterium]HPL73115.1 PilZ domain-containing protein [Candidatus Sumerlaeota bacterium]HRU53437.1 PilZ domain-containing protein [Candidatus Sumerlaeia bacterium]
MARGNMPALKPEELRVYPRYKAALSVELQSISAPEDAAKRLPSIRFNSVTKDISLGGILVDLADKAKGLEPAWQPDWFQDRFFWVHVKGIATIPEGIFAKARCVCFVGEDQTHPKAVGMEFQDLVGSIIARLKIFLEGLAPEKK